MFVGPRERVVGIWVLQPELTWFIQCEGVKGANAYGCFHIRVFVFHSRAFYA